MKSVHLLAAVAVATLAGCSSGSHSTTHQPAASRSPSAVSSSASHAPVHCHENAGLPDASCTPGALNLSVTQASIGTTICKTGWTATVRPPVSYTEPLKIRQIAQYGYADTSPADYEEDHLLPLELGGSPTSPLNLWPEPHAGGKYGSSAKDKVENAARAAVCAGQIQLATAQHQMIVNWENFGRKLGVFSSRTTAPPDAPSPAHRSAPLPTRQAAPSSPPATHAAPSSPAAHAACHPLTNSGHCYEPGEFCRNADAGMSGIAGDGKAIVCRDHHWETS